ncbi:MAG: SDR family oxidoreductase [Rhodospirillales bacterium]|nr:SDR family oxidoreductase [Rhodospirillales bacterium]MSP81066.1 SDR family oxidoreductase [Rhodospirillales bacterium]
MTAPPKAALVTGAGRRIGRAIALALAEDGWTVAIHYNRSEAEANETVAAIEAKGGRARAVRADLARETETESLIERAADAVGPLTLLVNNASIFDNDLWDTVTRESWNQHMQVNLRAPFVLIQEFAHRRPPGVPANVVNLIDERVWNPTPFFVSYTVSKMGLWGLTQTLALALAPEVRVNAIGPGPTLQSVHQTPEQFRRQWAMMPLRRPIAVEEICRALRFILDAPSMTGQMIALDGGQHLGWAQPGGAAPEN